MKYRAKLPLSHAAGRCRGFSLIELLIVVSIILIIASMAIPNLLRAKIAANESSAVGSLRTIAAAQVLYQSTFPTIGFAATLSTLGPGASSGCPTGGPTSANACIIDWVLAQAGTAATSKSGYYFGMSTTVENSINMGYTLGAAPATFNTSGVRGFCVNEDGVIRFVPVLNGPPVANQAGCLSYFPMQ